MLGWSPRWIKERKHKNIDHLIYADFSLNNLPSIFSSFEEYRRLFLPLLLLEMWSFVCKEAEEKEQQGGEQGLPAMFYKPKYEGKFRVFTCCTVLTKSEGDRDPNKALVILDLPYPDLDDPKKKKIEHVFGFVSEHSKTRLSYTKLNETETQFKDLILSKKNDKRVT